MRLEAKNRFETKHSLELAFLKEAIAYVSCHFRRIGFCTSEGIGLRADYRSTQNIAFVSKMFLVLAVVFFLYSIGTGTGCVGEVQEPDMAAARSFTGCVLPSTIHGARATTGEQILPLIFSICTVL